MSVPKCSYPKRMSEQDGTPTEEEIPLGARMEETLHAMSKGSFPEGAICTGWISVSEWLDVNGEYWTYVSVDQTNPPWRHSGLLSWVLDSDVLRPNHDYDLDHDDE